MLHCVENTGWAFGYLLFTQGDLGRYDGDASRLARVMRRACGAFAVYGQSEQRV